MMMTMMMMMTASHGQTTTGPLKKNRNKNQIRILIWLISSFLAFSFKYAKLCSEFRKKYRGKFKTNLTFRKFVCVQFENKIQFTEYENK